MYIAIRFEKNIYCKCSAWAPSERTFPRSLFVFVCFRWEFATFAINFIQKKPPHLPETFDTFNRILACCGDVPYRFEAYNKSYNVVLFGFKSAKIRITF